MNISIEQYRNKLRAALLGRFAGCTLGAPVEGWTIDMIEKYGPECGNGYPPKDYWPSHPNPETERYIYCTINDFLRRNLKNVPCDDDIGYTLLSLLIAEEGGGKNFTLDDVAKTWLKYVTVACTAEEVALKNLQNGVAPEKAAEIDNPYDELIGADIRCDGYGYMCPGDPEKAAELAKTDALISHRANGVYGSMYFAAVIAIGFECGNIREALERGLEYIPSDCALYEGLRWALDIADEVKTPREAHRLVTERYPDMHVVHTINNACLTVFGLLMSGNDIGKVISNCVAMAYDCDCTAATAGSVAGACLGMDALDPKWYDCFNDTVLSYFNGPREYSIEDLLARFEKIAISE